MRRLALALVALTAVLAAPAGAVVRPDQPELDEDLLAEVLASSAASPAPPAAADPGCDGEPCGPEADGPDDRAVCDSHDGYSFTAGARQTGGACPAPYADGEPHVGAGCPPDDWRRGDVRLDAIAEAEGCGPMLGDWT